MPHRARTQPGGDAVSLPPCPRDDCTATGHHYHIISMDGCFARYYSPHVKVDTPDPRLHVLERRLPDWAADDLADLLAELDEAVTL